MIAGYKLPRRMVVIDEVPLTAAGKPDGKMAQTMFS
jgi:non-ribosomal peptide synthetase component E (peptide arylation enzyme)